MHQIIAYLKYLWKAKNQHGVHSPFVFNLMLQVLRSKKHFYAFDEIEFVKKQLLEKNNHITQVEYGAGSRNNTGDLKSISTLVKQVSMPKQQGEWLFKLVQLFQPNSILEMGTCLGISTLYLGLENKNRKIITLEGNPDSAAIAQKIFSQLQLNNVEILQGKFNKTLAVALSQLKQIDFAFVDGNHRYEPTMKYFHQIFPFTHENSLLIFHDIHWSKEMEKAWAELCNEPQVSISIDLFYFGILFFKKGMIKQHFILK